MERNFNRHIGYYVQETARILTRVHNEMLKRHDISYAQFRVLNSLWEQDGMKQLEIAELLHITPASLSGLLSLLAKKGFIERQVDELDTRSRRIHLTERGKSLKAVSWDIMEELETVLSGDFTTGEKELMLEWMRKVMQRIAKKEAALCTGADRDQTVKREE